MKTLNRQKSANRILKNVKIWNGKNFSEVNAIYLDSKGNFASAADISNAEEFDCKGSIVIPALFGLGLDFMEPLRDDVYTFKDGLDAMHIGGFYGGLYESYANPIDDSEKLSAFAHRLHLDSDYDKLELKFLGAYSKGFGTDSLAEMLELSRGKKNSYEGVVGFGDGASPIPHSRFLRLAMEYGKMTDKRFFFMPMDKTLRASGCVHEGAYSDMLGMKGIPKIAETIAAYTVLETAKFLNVPVHFKQVSCGETLDLVRNARNNGIDVTCDVDLYHLLLDDSYLTSLNSAYHFCPPLRSKSDCNALWNGLADGTVDAISVNHFPVLRQDTEVNFEDSMPGAISLEVALMAIWKKLSERVGYARALDLLSYAPAKLVGAQKAYSFTFTGRANIVVLAENSMHKVTCSDFAGHVCNCPLIGKELSSSIKATYIGGVWNAF